MKPNKPPFESQIVTGQLKNIMPKQGLVYGVWHRKSLESMVKDFIELKLAYIDPSYRAKKIDESYKQNIIQIQSQISDIKHLFRPMIFDFIFIDYFESFSKTDLTSLLKLLKETGYLFGNKQSNFKQILTEKELYDDTISLKKGVWLVKF